MDGHHVAAVDVDVDLERLGVLRFAGRAHAVEDEQDVVVVVVELRALIPLARVLDRERVPPKLVRDRLQRGLVGGVEVEPEELVSGPELGDLVVVVLGEYAHRRAP